MSESVWKKNKKSKMPSPQYLREIYRYNSISGDLFFAKSICYRKKIGDKVGGRLNGRYLYTFIHRNPQLLHRIIWTMCNGQIPEGMQIDHIDHDILNNRLNNLRLVSPAENARNTGFHKNNTSGFTGIRWSKKPRKWRAEITLSGKPTWLGEFVDIKDAIKCRKEAELKYGFHPNHGVKKPV